MDTLPKELTIEIALNLKPADLVKFCAGNRKISQRICDSNDFWRRKLERDYPEEMKELKGIVIKNPKDVYMKRFSFISKSIEEFIPKYLDIVFTPTRAQRINNVFKKKFYEALYELYVDVSENYQATLKDPIYVNNEEDLRSDFFFAFSPRMNSFVPAKMILRTYQRLDPVLKELFTAFLTKLTIKDII